MFCRRGFAPTEIVVVLAIIGMEITLVIPAWASPATFNEDIR
jgi:type II secretory pathway pseudopilin PulG